MDIQKVTRIPIEIEAVQVTPTNVAEVAEWCKGTLTEATYRLMGGTHKMGAILLTKQGPKNDKTRTVLIGNWITKHKNTFKCWTLEAYEASFLPAVPRLRAGDLIRANNEVWAGWEGKVVDPQLVGVDFGARGMMVFEPDCVEKIDEMSSEQLQLNAGIVDAAENAETRPVEQIIEEMRQEAKDRIAAMEAENASFDPTERFKEGVLVKIVTEGEYWGQHGHIREILANEETRDVAVGFATSDYDREETEYFFYSELELAEEKEIENLCEQDTITIGKLRESLGMVDAQIRAITHANTKLCCVCDGNPQEHTREELAYCSDLMKDGKPWDPALPPASADERAAVISKGQDISYAEAIQLVQQEDQITINQFREKLGMNSIGSAGDELLTAGSIEHLRSLSEEDFAKFAAAQKVAETMTLQDFSANDKVATLEERDIDGVILPIGTMGLVTVVGVDLPDGGEGIEVLFSNEVYAYFAPEELRKV